MVRSIEILPELGSLPALLQVKGGFSTVQRVMCRAAFPEVSPTPGLHRDDRTSLRSTLRKACVITVTLTIRLRAKAPEIDYSLPAAVFNGCPRDR